MTEQKLESIRSGEHEPAGKSLYDVPALSDFEVAEAIKDRKELREGHLEWFADTVFYKAAQRLVELLDNEDPSVVVKAASKLIDLRRDTYKVRSTAKVMEDISDKLFDDGFNFTRQK
jgi:hypothetical protein